MCACARVLVGVEVYVYVPACVSVCVFRKAVIP